MKKILLASLILCALNADDYAKVCGAWQNEECLNAAKNCPSSDIFCAMKYLKIGCENGLAKVCYEAGDSVMLGASEHGYNVAVAKEFFNKGCDLGDGRSCAYLGDIYALNVESFNEFNDEMDEKKAYLAQKDINKANEFYERACKLGEKRACQILKNPYK